MTPKVPLRTFVLLLFSILSLLPTLAQAQFTLSGELLTRGQIRNGARTLPSPTDRPAIFVSQRARLNADYTHGTDFRTYFSFQDVRVWGDQSQENIVPTMNIYKAWGELYFGEAWALRIGRQGVAYDDGYLLMDPGWREAGRTHDAIRLTYTDSTFEAHLGGAYNANGASAFQQIYRVPNSYQNMQWLWARQELGANSHVAITAVRRDYQRPTTGTLHTTYTAGGEVGTTLGPWKGKLVGYYQAGTDTLNLPVNAWFGAIRLQYIREKVLLATFAHWLSGTDRAAILTGTQSENNSFDILYGFRHRYFGTMDYFYSTTYDPPTGLQDLQLRAQWMPKKNLSLRADGHLFASPTTIVASATDLSPLPRYLGSEVDLSFRYQWRPQVQFQGGYSQLWGTESLAALVGGDPTEVANWLWLQVYFTPTFFSTDKD